MMKVIYDLATWWLPIAAVAQYTIALVCYVFRRAMLGRLQTAAEKLKQKRLMIVFGSGGHTSEMLMMLEKFNADKYGRVYFVIA